MSKTTLSPDIDAQAEEIARLFNAKPKDGIKKIKEFCSANRGVEEEEQIALFFHKHRGSLDLEAVGDYLGSEENSSVLGYFTAQMDFQGKEFLAAMRSYCRAFSLPGEGQKISQIMASFGQSYHNQNPGKFHSSDGAEVLAFSCMMLTTDVHNANVKPEKKMTLAGFISNNRGIDGGKDIDRSVLEDIYADIQANPLGLRFTKTLPGITFEPTEKELETTIQALKAAHRDKFKEEKPKGIWGKLFGHKNTITIDGEDGAQVKINTYEPGWFSRNKATANIQPFESGNKIANDASLKLAGQISACFPCKAICLKATFAYQAKDITEAYISGLKASGKTTLASTESQRITPSLTSARAK